MPKFSKFLNEAKTQMELGDQFSKLMDSLKYEWQDAYFKENRVIFLVKDEKISAVYRIEDTNLPVFDSWGSYLDNAKQLTLTESQKRK